jgi:4-hydroxy-3-methylbut-2-enyl diphosphate reductase
MSEAKFWANLQTGLYLGDVGQTYFQKGFGLKSEVGPVLARTYQSTTVERLKTLGYQAGAGGIHIKLAKEFGFCYGVDRAVDYAYQTRRQFPDRRVFLCGEIIHNPDVNQRLRDMGIEILGESKDPVERFREIGAGDVVILPAFGVSVPELQQLSTKQCVMVDTTCGSVLNVWKKVHYYAKDRYTVIIHGKHYHEETRATASQAMTHDNGHYLCVKDVAETKLVCDFIRGTISGTELMSHFGEAASAGFDPDLHLQRVGLANQTTMLMSETLTVQETLRRAMIDRYGADDLESRFRAFDTICSATQERQDAVLEMLDAGGLDRMIVIGGYNSSNTQALARMCAPRVTTYYVDSPQCITDEGVRHRAVGAHAETVTPDWLPAGEVSIGVTAGASTPDSVVGETIERILALRGRTAADLTQAADIAQGSTYATASTFAEATVDKTADKQSFA